jgi:serine kinase of HPr protein (carbohydrate metabolism regulator)
MRKITNATTHATALLIGEGALLLRGSSGSGKSFIALQLIAEAQACARYCVRLIADDRVYLDILPNNILQARAPDSLKSLIEQRHCGLLTTQFEHSGIVKAILDLDAKAPRLPAEEENVADISGVKLPRFYHMPKTPFSLLQALELMKKASAHQSL